ncbi:MULTISPECIES: sensor histidine kinase [Limnospira]|uniref:histidine kinase n=1 Tax=Limnospira indica PCC 8005 TaxID=376219 RepID=A0A9P1P209_9CYAN|nr:HAMP domain-containing sensor histidine kinase [Limnospira indica]CDM98434.1 Signal transduction histidine kinase [Limnospira indica PCC 8005]
MGWNEFIYLGAGLGLGWWLGQRQLSGGGMKLMTPKPPLAKTSRSPLPESGTGELDAISDPQVAALAEKLQQTQLAYHLAVEMAQFKAGFLARTSHELRSPLNSIIGFLQLILADLCENPEEERDFIQQAHDATLRMIALMDEVIMVAKTEYGSQQMNLQPLKLAEMLAEVEQLTHLQAANRSIRLSIIPPDPQVYVIGDRPRLKQVLLSLVDGAIAGMESGKVQVSTHVASESGYVHIWIDDQRPISAWSESWDLLESTLKSPASNSTNIDPTDIALSPGMRLLMNQTLLGLMNGRLDVVAVPPDSENRNFTRTQCSLPLG